ncbi:MAG: hypothetical protein G01um10143_800 [Parcubacteria group bacterium Gr01-1014_3]|nr:MAG: hypothetical protein G01um10143_800 [Parcubacteria group bacterium Gr01-1014_3]
MAKKSEAPTYFLNLHSVAKGHLLIVKVVVIKARKLKNATPESEAVDIWRALISYLPLKTIEALEKLIKKRLDTFYAAKSHLQVEKLEKKKKDRRFKYRCPDCHQATDGSKHGSCDMVLGRRGWRKLGEYDG